MEPTAINRPSPAHAIARPSIILHVLLIHGDDVIVSKLDKKLYICLHKVAKRDQWQDVVRIVREKGGVLNMVICEVEVESLVDEVVQEFIKQIDSEINIPVTLVAPDSQLARVLNGTSDSCYYASKGFMQFEVQMKNLSSTGSANGGLVARVSETAPLNEGLRRKNHSDQVDGICLNPAKRARVVWSPELHRVFADAVHKLGIEKAVPKKILELMNTPGLTRENVASHLQKHRMCIKKQQSEAPVQQSEAPVQQDGLAGGRQNWVRNPTLPSSRAQPVICRTSQPSIHQIRSFDQVGMKLDLHGVDQRFLNSQIYGCDPSAVGLGEGCPTWSFDYLDMVLGPCNNEQSSLMNIRQQCPNSTSVIASDQGLVEMGQRYVSAGDASLNFGQQHPPDQTNQAELQWRYNVAQHGGSYSADVTTFPSLPNITSHAASP